MFCSSNIIVCRVFYILSKYSISVCYLFSFYTLYLYLYFLLLILFHLLLYLHIHLTPSPLPTHLPPLPNTLPQLTSNPPLLLLNLSFHFLFFLKLLHAWLLELQILINRELSNRNPKIKCLLIHFCIYFKLTKY